MRKNVLFIAKFDNVLKGMNSILAKTFNMQMCPPTLEMIEKTLFVMEIDLVLLYISGLSEAQIAGLRDKLHQSNLKVPLVVLGTAEECEDFGNLRQEIYVAKYLHRPIAIPLIVEALGAILSVEIEKAAEKDSAPNISIADFADSLETDNRRCLLVVDDNGSILRAMKMLLEKDYKVNLANSAKSALESIMRERPDAMLLDYEMPGINGRQLLELLRNNQDTQNLPVFFLTGVSDQERIKEVFSLKPQGYFLKSSSSDTILDALDKFFNS